MMVFFKKNHFIHLLNLRHIYLSKNAQACMAWAFPFLQPAEMQQKCKVNF